jgi:hypothetical protein
MNPACTISAGGDDHERVRRQKPAIESRHREDHQQHRHAEQELMEVRREAGFGILGGRGVQSRDAPVDPEDHPEHESGENPVSLK